MGHVEKRGKERWVAVYKDDTGRRRAKSFRRKLDADKHLASVTVDVLQGKYVDPNAGRVTLGDYARQWVDERPIRESTKLVYRYYLTKLDAIDNVPLGDLRPSTLRSWQAGMCDGLSVSTASTVRGVVAAIVKSAVDDRLIPSSPFAGVKPPPKPLNELITPMPVSTVLAYRDNIAARLRAAVVLTYGCGLRQGEAMGVTVDRIDFLRRTVKIDRQRVRVASDGRPVFGLPKTAASIRIVPMPQFVVDELAAHIQRYGTGPDGVLFVTTRGAAVSRIRLHDAWHAAEVRTWAKAAGHLAPAETAITERIELLWREAHPNGHDWTFHDLRHFYASVLIDGGESVKVVQARLGHKSAEETLRTYAHLWPDNAERTRAVLDEAFKIVDADTSNARATGVDR